MRVGLIAEGPADLAVLSNRVKGVLDVEREQILFIRPDLTRDETDLHDPKTRHFSNWGHVRAECQSRTQITTFLESPIYFDDEDPRRAVVVHIDTAECHLYEVPRPDRKAEDYAPLLLALVRAKVDEWLGGAHDGVIRAVALEETDAWILPLHVAEDSTKKLDAKGALGRVLEKAGHKPDRDSFRNYATLSAPFRKEKERNKARKHNLSLDAFLADLEALGP